MTARLIPLRTQQRPRPNIATHGQRDLAKRLRVMADMLDDGNLQPWVLSQVGEVLGFALDRLRFVERVKVRG